MMETYVVGTIGAPFEGVAKVDMRVYDLGVSSQDSPASHGDEEQDGDFEDAEALK